MTTAPLIPMVARYRVAKGRVVRTFAANVGADTAAQIFGHNVGELRLFGLGGPGLLFAAVHMAAGI